MKRTIRGALGLAVGAVAIAAVPAFGLAGVAAAQSESGEGTGTDTTMRPARPALTDEQQQCLADQGVTLPQRPADGATRTPPTDEHRAAMKAAAEACGLPARPAGPGPGMRHQLTDEQRQCLADQVVTLPERPADGATRTPPTDEQRAAMKAAAEACGLPTRPDRPAGFGGQSAQTTADRLVA